MNVFERALNALNHDKFPFSDCLAMSKSNLHHTGLHSIVIREDNGYLLRFFHATQDIKFGGIAFHTHLYNLEIGVVIGEFKHHEAKSVRRDPLQRIKEPYACMPIYEYKTPLVHSEPSFTLTHPAVPLVLSEYSVLPGTTLHLRYFDFHTVSVKAGTTWLVRETPPAARPKSTAILGRPFEVPAYHETPRLMALQWCNELQHDLLKLVGRHNAT